VTHTPARLSVENPAVRRIAAQMGITVLTDQEGKDAAETDTGIVIESRYFVGDVLVTRERDTDSLGLGSRGWYVNGEVFRGPVDAFRHADLLARTGL
jgi:hypothetical protein